VDLASIGAIAVKGLSLRPCHGNPPPRICETDAGMLNAIGLQNVGVEVFLEEKLPELHRRGATVIANVWGDAEEDYVAVVSRIGSDRRVAAIELNVSCPNVVKGGMVFGNDPKALAALVAAVRPATRLPLIVKLSPNAGDVVACAAAAVESGAEALSLINTIVGLAIDLPRREPKIGFTTGGLSGPAIRPIALRMVWEVKRALPQVPIIGMGGIESVENVVEFLVAGASAVQVGTANFRDPGISGRLVIELAAWCEERGVTRVTELVGTLRTRPRPDHTYA
jgi:dihydroorotate dehydrogenase (NAD+) catalytic subunit